MYRAILLNGQLKCADYEHGEHGVELFDADGELLGFVPYDNLEALLTQAAYEEDEPSVQ